MIKGTPISFGELELGDWFYIGDMTGTIREEEGLYIKVRHRQGLSIGNEDMVPDSQYFNEFNTVIKVEVSPRVTKIL